ncbi:BspA family leucine-rich repeat surface protein [Bifidobacterium sp. ESL0790]|uniref:BspA family leucine-rich repeat surface protein n=1 Tax=Bifidobacterium sp. ESL0790 TaxID=2983233 RepID=UPI0023F69471|nr:BspA family leucine-rich repeat surface protein [Bifidobacterium sp. ESL0790]WEV72390.1 BspA family leucine-rich repeat surface protein [Bifidobacterium sp. ESL0790]
MALRHNGIGGKIAVMLTALALLSANAPAAESDVPAVQASLSPTTTSESLATPQPQDLTPAPDSGQTPDTTPVTPGTKPAKPTPKPATPNTDAGTSADNSKSPQQHHAQTPNTVGPQDATCNQPGEHQWHGNDGGVGIGNPVTLNWNEHVDGNDCVLELESGVEADFGYINDGSAPIPWHDPSVTKLTVRHHAGTPEDPKVKALDGYGLFDGHNLPNLKTADLAELDVSQAANLNSVFRDHLSPLTITGLDKWNTAAATDMGFMFDQSSGITSLDLSNWNTHNVTSMTAMFRACTNLKTIGNPGLDIPEGISTTEMFKDATSLPCLTKTGRHHWALNGNTLNWNEHTDTDNIGCVLELESGVEADFGYINDGSAPIPWHDPSVTKLTVRHHAGTPEDPKVKALDGYGLFDGHNLPNLKTADLAELDVSQAANLNSVFRDHLSPLTITGLDKWNTAAATDMGFMFDQSSGITSLDLSNWNTHNVTSMTAMFRACTNLTALDLNSWDTTQVTATTEMLPANLKALRLGKKTTLKNAAGNNAFSNVANATWADKSGSHNPPDSLTPPWSGNTSALATRAATNSPAGEYVVTTFSYTFPTACTQPGTYTWETLTWSETLTGEGENAECVLSLDSGTVPDHAGTTVTTGIPWTDDSVTKVTVKEGVKLAPNTGETAYAGGRMLFGRLPKVKTIDVTNLNGSGNTSMFGMFWEDPVLERIDGLKKLDTSKVTDMVGVFNVTSLTSLDLSGWDTHNVIDMTYLFTNSPNLKTLDLNGWDTSNVTNMNTMLPANLQAIRLGKKTKLLNDPSKAAFANVANQNWADKSGSHNPPDSLTPPWSGTTVQLATRASTSPLGEYVVSTFSYSFSVACTQPGTHTWGTLTWSETLTGEGENAECVLSLDSGTVPDHTGTTMAPGIPWTDDSVTKVTVKEGVKLAPNAGETTYAGGRMLFGRLPKVKTIDVTNLNGSGNTSLFGMFWEDPVLETITGINNLDTSKVTDMVGAFNVTSLTSLDLTKWDTSNATDISYLFENCPNLTTITGINKWDTRKATNTAYMFKNDTSLTTLDLNSWDTTNVTNTVEMLPPNLQALRLGKKTTLKNATNNAAFADVNQPDTWVDKSGSHNPVWGLGSAWTGNTNALAARAATDNPIGEYVISSVSYSFPTACTQPGSHNWDTLTWSETLTGEGESAECVLSLDSGTVPNHNTGDIYNTQVPWTDDSVTSVTVKPNVSLASAGGRFLFGRLPKAQTIDVTNLNSTGNTDMFGMFWEDPVLETIAGLKNLDTSSVTSMRGTFNVSGLTGVDVSGWNTSNVTDMNGIFANNPNLKTLDLNDWDTTHVTDIQDMLPAGLQALRLGKKTTLKNAAGNNAFSNVSDHTWLDQSTNPSSTVGNTAALATRAAGTSPAGEYIVDGFSYTFPIACTHPGTNTWDTLTWSETLEGEGESAECVLSLDSGTVPNHNGGILNTYVPWTGDNVTKATVQAGVKLAPNTGQTTYTSGSYLFANMPKLKSADVGNLTTTGNTSMEGMFYKTPNLETLTGTENWDTSSVKNMKSTFNATNLAKINVSNWNTHNVTSMNVMFTNCHELTQITGIGDLDTSFVRNMGAMFSGDYKLTSLDLNNWNTTQVNNMSFMFYNDYKLTSLDLNSWNTASITNATAVSEMLPQNLQALRLGKKTKLATTAFSPVNQSVTWVDKSGSHNDPWTLNPSWSGTTSELATRASTTPLGEYVVSGVTYSFPTACTQPGSHTWGTLNWSETLTGEGANAECVLSLDSGTVPDNSAGTPTTTGVPWSDDSVTKATVQAGVKLAPNTSETTYAGGAFLFGRLPKVKTIDVTNLATAGNTSMQGMFWEDPALTSITGLKGFDTSKVTNMNSTFNVTSLSSLDVSGWHTGNVTDMNGIFSNNPNLTTITGINKWNTGKVTDTGDTFLNDTSLTTLDLNGWDTTSATSMDGMLPPNLKALRLGKKTTLSNTTNNKAFANVNQPDTWADTSGMSSPTWSGNTNALAARAATTAPAGAYVISTFNYTFPPLPLSALPFTGLTRQQILRILVLLLVGAIAFAAVAITRHLHNRKIAQH